MKTILQLSNEEARRYFLHANRFCTIDLPRYFDFQPLLDALDKHIGQQKLCDVFKEDPSDIEEINYKFLTNKDGNFAWRPLKIINPVIYICLVNRMTECENWKLIQQRFAHFQSNDRITCYSLPIVAEESEKQLKTDTASNINHWWEKIEQQAIELALEYNTVLVTDISNCYESIYTHSIAWALHGKPEARNHRKDNPPVLLGCIIDKLLQQMSYRQTNGIPQGSVLMNFIAEMVLGYVDDELSTKLKDTTIDYRILRYRDDFKIFAHSEEDAVKIAKILSEVLSEVNLRLNPQKTFVSTKIIHDVIKPDKLYWNEAKQGEKTLQRHLLLIHSLAEKYPNSGTLATAMSKFIDRLYPLKVLQEDSSRVLISILVDIAYYNPRVYSEVVVCIGKILSIEPNKTIVDDIYRLIETKFAKKPNIGYWKVWFQRLTIKSDRVKEYGSGEKLCQIAAGNTAVQLWAIEWLKEEYQQVFKENSIFNMNEYSALEEVPRPEEAKIFVY